MGVLSVYADGYGFVRTAEGDFFIPEKKMGGAFDGDYVEVAPLPKRGSSRAVAEGLVSAQESPAARVVRVIDRAHDTVVGRYEVADPFGVVVPLDSRIHYDIFTLRSENPTISHGSLVRVRIVSFPTARAAATGHIEEVLEEQDGKHYAIDALIERRKVDTRFSEAALEQASSAAIDEDDALLHGYVDLRDRMIFTVDPDDAKDYDDAVSLERALGDVAKGRVGAGQTPIAWRLGVHIADVAHYVPWDSPLDLQARGRATSIYLADRVIPMLPERISNDVCSLKSGVTRRCMTVDLYLDEDAQVVSTHIYPALMQSRRRMTYTEVQDILDASEGAFMPDGVPFSSLEERLVQLDEISQKRRIRRECQGAPSFDSVEAKLLLDENNEPIEVRLRRKSAATELIEEAMLMANEAVAQYMVEHAIPGLFRVHEAPFPANCAALIPVFEEYPWYEQVNEAAFAQGNSAQIQKVLALSKGRPEADTVSSLLLRAMKRAVYSPVCAGHFGLAMDEYLHFTSPIRRYPDLVVHRQLKAFLEKGRAGVLSPEAKRAVSQETVQLPWLAEHCSKMERLAEDLSRETTEFMLVTYLQRFLGQTFSATISGVMSYGIYVRLDNTAEGLLPLRELGTEYFMFDGVRHQLTGEESGRCYRLGQRVVVVLAAADPKTRSLAFRLKKSDAHKGKMS